MLTVASLLFGCSTRGSGNAGNDTGGHGGVDGYAAGAGGNAGSTGGFVDAGLETSSAGTGDMPDAGEASDAGGGTAGTGDADAGAAAGGAIDTPKFVGNITTVGEVRPDFASYWNQISPENEGKWGSVEGSKDVMNWAGLDAIYVYTQTHGTIFKQHNFIWGRQQPSWLASLSAAEQKVQVEQWIQQFCERYPNIAMIDVVNEPTHNQPVYMNAIGGAGASGYDWIVQAFEWAHQYCPNAILLVNDFNNIEYSDQRDSFIRMAKAVKNAGAPINAVGAQAHDAHNIPTATVNANLDTLANEIGLPVYITEFDIDEADDDTQKTEMQDLMTMFEENANVKGITLWGYIVGRTWQTNSGLMNSNGTMRPAMQWLVSSGYLLK
jgi:endo-1,4-beta-xylanase